MKGSTSSRSMAAAHADYLASASDRYQRAHGRLDELLAARFPTVERVVEHDMPMWQIRRPEDAPMPEATGTIDPELVHVGLVERKAGLTLHLWYPPEYELLAEHAEELKAAGLKVMTGCVQYNRKGELPVEAIVPLLDHIHENDGF